MHFAYFLYKWAAHLRHHLAWRTHPSLDQLSVGITKNQLVDRELGFNSLKNGFFEISLPLSHRYVCRWFKVRLKLPPSRGIHFLIALPFCLYSHSFYVCSRSFTISSNISRDLQRKESHSLLKNEISQYLSHPLCPCCYGSRPH